MIAAARRALMIWSARNAAMAVVGHMCHGARRRVFQHDATVIAHIRRLREPVHSCGGWLNRCNDPRGTDVCERERKDEGSIQLVPVAGQRIVEGKAL
eukprot:767259-Hanusia_phi.AAC.5